MIYLKHLFFLFSIFVILFIFFILVKPEKINNEKEKNFMLKIEKIRPAYVAGQFYPASKKELENTIDFFLNNAQKEKFDEKIEIKALIVPHAGYVFSGQTAAFGYKQLENNFNKIFILADNHNSEALYSGISIPTNFTHFQTPLGEIKISNLINSFLENNLFKNISSAHKTHVIEIHLPFLQKILSNFEIIPMALSGLDENQRKELTELISQNLDSNSLVIASSDLSHFHPYEKAVKLDKICLEAIINGDIEKVKKCEICGPNSVLTLMEIAKQKKWKTKFLDYKNSGDITGDKNNVVGYASVIFYQEKELNKKEQKILLDLARKSIELRIKENKIFEPDLNLISQYPKLLEKKGAFVTLFKDGKLKGCIGNILPQEKLYLSVQNNAINAAINDPRFLPIERKELDEIDIEISVLEIPQLIKANPIREQNFLTIHADDDINSLSTSNNTAFSNGVNHWQEYLDKLIPLKDGVIIKLGSNQATYLPQVWEQIPEKENFLNSLCQKAGLDYECWKDPETKIYKYQVQMFKE
ncbi:MAG: AmmeMemoRadiSam system protein B [Candidatus Kuenenbacteria bacterium]